jgi:glutathione synthase/RimK-type ligase-like ATP-grasp enzyme
MERRDGSRYPRRRKFRQRFDVDSHVSAPFNRNVRGILWRSEVSGACVSQQSCMSDFTFVTYADLPDLDPDDRLAVVELERSGATVAAEVWSDPDVDWSSAGTVVIRSTWDYHLQHDAFVSWVDRVAAHTSIWNPPALVRRNSVKTYLRELESAGVPVVPTVWLEQGMQCDLHQLMHDRRWEKAVIKPVVGLATAGVRMVTPDDGHAQAHLDGLLRNGGAMVQPFMPAVTSYGERALVYFGGSYSHAASKVAFQQLAVAGEAGERAAVASPAERAAADLAVATLDSPWLYARVDVVPDEAGRPIVMEFELVEPSLFLSLGDGAPRRFADALLAVTPWKKPRI